MKITIHISSLLIVSFYSIVYSGCTCPADQSQDFYIYPYLQNVTQSGIHVMWWTTNDEGEDWLEYGPEFGQRIKATSEFVESFGKVLHMAKVDELEPDKVVPYRVRSGSLQSPDYSFRTAPEKNAGFRFIVMGDGRTDDNAVIRRHQKTTSLALSRQPRIAFHSGDMVDTGDLVHWDRFYRRIATASDPTDPGPPFASKIPYYLLVGNHEIYTEGSYSSGNLDTSMARYQALVHVESNKNQNPRWNERYYAFEYGPVGFIVLDANNTSDDELDNCRYLEDGSTPDWHPGSEQHRWLLAQLERSQKLHAFTFVLMHPAPYSRGSHGDPEDGISGHQLRVLDPIFRQYGVDGVISGHDHFVERCLTGPEGFEEQIDDGHPANLNYFVNGNAGHSTRDAAEGWQNWMDIRGNDGSPFYTRYFYDWQGTEHTSFLEVDIERLENGRFQATFRTVRDDERVFDEISIERSRGSP